MKQLVIPSGMPGDDSDRNASVRGQWQSWFTAATNAINSVVSSGTTAERPTKILWNGRVYLDESLGKPIWYFNGDWIDATGTIV